MPGRKRKYTAEQEGRFKICILDILNNSEESLTIDEIKAQNPMVLGTVTSQKLSRVLGNLIEMGLAKKSKSKSTNRMVYKAVSKMIEQGYEVDEEQEVIIIPNLHKDWELDEEMRLKREKEVEECN